MKGTGTWTARRALRMFVPGEPVGWQRPGVRVIGKGKARRAQLYTQNKTEDYEALVRDVGRLAVIRARWPADRPVAVELLMMHKRPKFPPKGHPCHGHEGRAWLTKKPDVDNVAKAVLDGLVKGGVVADDVLVVRLECTQVYGAVGEAPGVHVVVRRLPGRPEVE